MSSYIGRFAPSPTGPLHAGSLVAAMASFLDARQHDGQWLLRIDDADLTRVQAGSAQTIVQQLKHYGFEWHGAITHTQDFRGNHCRALQGLEQAGHVYGCSCSRATLTAQLTEPLAGERRYTGQCREKDLSAAAPECRALRLKVGQTRMSYIDRWAGSQSQSLDETEGDFVVWRPESVVGIPGGLHSYQFTMPCDDAAQGVTHVVRGADLLTSTARQLYVYDRLSLARPSYLHVPVVLTGNGVKLSKQNHAAALPSTDPLPTLERALMHLGAPPTGAHTMAEFWRIAQQSWAQRFN